MGSFFSILSWLFTDPVADRGRPRLYLSTKPAFAVRKYRSTLYASDEKDGASDPSGSASEVISMREFVETRCPSFASKYEPTWWLPKCVNSPSDD